MGFGAEPPSGDTDLAPRTVIERYRVEGLLGRGGMASVYTVRHLQLGSVHALKIVDTTNEQLCRRLLQEGRVQARLSHTNVVAVTDAVRVNGRPGLVLEYVAGPTLGEVLRAHALTPAQVDHLAIGILRGVEVAHGLGFAHRDLKPGNILIARSPEGPVPKVADFGLAKVLEGTGLDTTRPNMAMGTPSYMAPEQISDARTADTVSDVFSLGAILYEMLTGEKCFAGNTVFEIFRRIGSGEYVPLSARVPGLPARMVETVEAALQVERSDRAASVRQLRELWTSEGWLPSTRDPFRGELDALFAERTPQLEPFTPTPEAYTPAPATRAESDGAAGATVIPDLSIPTSTSEAPTTAPPPAADEPLTLPTPVHAHLAPTPTPASAPSGTPRWLAGAAVGLIALLLLGVGWVAGGGGSPESVRAPVPAPEVAASVSAPPVAEPAPPPPPAPAPSEAAPTPPAPAPAAAPEPPAPAAVSPVPKPSKPRSSGSAVRATTTEVTAAPEPAPPAGPAGPAASPSEPTTGHVEIVGDPIRVFFRPEGTADSIYDRDLPPGEYTVYGVFGDAPQKLHDIRVTAGATLTLKCRADMRVCRL